MFKVSKKFSFSSAHRLFNHFGKCANLHGHNYNITIIIEAQELNEDKVVLDYYHFNKYKEYIDTYFDHALLIDYDDKIMQEFAEKIKTKYFILEKTTCECIATHFKNIFPEISNVIIQESESTQCFY